MQGAQSLLCERLNIQKKMSEHYPSWRKGILSTPAPSKGPSSSNRGDIVNRIEGFEETDWEYCGQGMEQEVGVGVGVGRKLRHGKNSSEGHSPKRPVHQNTEMQSEDYRMLPYPDTLLSHQKGSSITGDHSSNISKIRLLSEEE